jgi:ribosomal protein S21
MSTVVKAYQGESTDSVIKRFKRRSLTDNVVLKVREKEFYKKPALLKKEKNKEMERRKFHEKLERERAAKNRS